MNQDEVKQNLLAPAQWLRILLMAGYALALWVLGMVLIVVVITQVVTALLTGSANANLRQFGALLAIYIRQIIAFLVYATELKPFPFAPFPAEYDAHTQSPAAAPGPATAASSDYSSPHANPYAPQPANPDVPPSDRHLYGVDDGPEDAGDDWRNDSSRG